GVGEQHLTATVGFIRDLPSRLLASFSTTLAEAREADLLALTVDLSDPEWPMHLRTTEAQLDAIGASELPRFLVFNKRDLVEGPLPDLDAAAEDRAYRVVSSLDASDVDDLRDALVEAVRTAQQVTVVLHVPYAASEVSSMIYASCRVLDTEADDDGLVLSFQGSPAHVARILARAEEAGCQRR
ncbi:MAG: GTPase HflX, partial [Myxococcota bacterium]